MPTKGKADEDKWQRAKQQAARSKGKSVSELKGGDYALVMHIYKKMAPQYFKKKSAFFYGSVLRLASQFPEIKQALEKLIQSESTESSSGGK